MELMVIIQVLVLALPSCLMRGVPGDVHSQTDSSTNNTQLDKDMYVVHATVYQVGIITNRTDNETDKFDSNGNQEYLTLYHTNGTNVDLSAIPEPILTNVTAESLLSVAPVSDTAGHSMQHDWEPWEQLAYPAMHPSGNVIATDANDEKSRHKRALDNIVLQLFKRGIQEDQRGTPIEVVNGTTLIPPEAGVLSIGLPPLLSLNSNFSGIPVPIPNTSVVHYTRVNTLVKKTLKCLHF